jgi:hypothetical protein
VAQSKAPRDLGTLYGEERIYQQILVLQAAFDTGLSERMKAKLEQLRVPQRVRRADPAAA